MSLQSMLYWKTLKTENGPFTSYDEIEQHLDSDLPDNTKILIKNKRLYNEVQYARYASTSLRTTAAVFRLKRNHKNLDT